MVVIGTNVKGQHNGGLARLAFEKFGARMGQSTGLMGQSYGIPTFLPDVDLIRPFVNEFIAFAKAHSELFFYVPEIGCGHAGFTVSQMAELFADARDVENICLPESFCQALFKLESGHDPIQADKTEIYNVVIIDESGSMCCLKDAVMQGFNDTLTTIRENHKKFGDNQTHFLSLVLFNSDHYNLIYDKATLDRVRRMHHRDYNPTGGTPLYDAIGKTVSEMRDYVASRENAAVMVTIITDGMENSSTKYHRDDINHLISELKEEGWQFTLIGAGVDAEQIGSQISISNTLTVGHSEAEYRRSMEADSRSRSAMCYSMYDKEAELRYLSKVEKAKERSKLMEEIAKNELSKE